ncbi:MAG: hypothetical protein PUE84_01915 [Firmicutes bacterium]|nr:hypothetical protein [Bacillota bacterium]
MQRGLRNAKTPKQMKAERKGSGKDLAVATARIIGIGLVAGTALVVGTNRVMKKLFGKDEPKLAEDAELTETAVPEEVEDEPEEDEEI